MALLVRTWNVFHGNADPPERRAYLEEMVGLAVSDDPDVVCLQEVPVWALARLEDWSGMAALGAVAARPLLPPRLGRIVTGLNHGLLRSAVTGQANAVLVARRHRVLGHEALVLNPRSGRERRVCQAVRLDAPVLVANLHATGNERLADEELQRAVAWLDGLAPAGEPLILAGDANVLPARSETFRALDGFTEPEPRIDWLLARGLPARTAVWPEERRRLAGRLLSDHAPVEAVVG
ncbi:MAG: endonuclease/exonuclease/phosphatase family protein [Actinobacteria bacterium]|nr:endonuclease/exonuclease/phosphatase family protein [Actinomycetota bacterium]MBV8561475.1 endonuclease/exonuclease/phosphatase family protein [Actinomycetota bacterium]